MDHSRSKAGRESDALVLQPVIDWKDPEHKISRHFTVREAIWLPKWHRMADEADGLGKQEKLNLLRFFQDFMDPVRDLLKAPIIVHDAFRPTGYNQLVGGATNSAHLAQGEWAACDFHPDFWSSSLIEDCDQGRDMLLPELERLGIRMEDNGSGATWVHVDNHPPGASGKRFFRP